MNRDKKIIYIISFVIFAALTLALFVNLGSSKIVTAILLVPLTVLTWFGIRKRGSVSPHKKEVLLLSLTIGTIYVVLVQMTGIFFGFYKNPYFVTTKIFFTTILPITAIIITSEIIRSVMLKQKNAFASVLAFLSCLLAEILSFSNLAGITSFNRFMDLVGLTLFPAISANVYYHFISRRYGAFPNIFFRLLTTLYVYFVPSVSAMSDALLVCIKIFLPLGMLALVSELFEKKQKFAVKKGGKLSAVTTVLTIAIIVSVAMLISCQFRFGAIVVATESMTGEINKGDMIIYERYDNQTIKEGQVVVFLQNGNRIIHRVVEIEHIGDEVRYYTKGDANETRDSGYITDREIVGVTDIKVAYAGFPTLWLRELLQPSNQ